MMLPLAIGERQQTFALGVCKHCFMFDSVLLRSLRAVVERKTVSAAAEHLGYTPSAVSQQLARLRREAGVELLVRHGRYLLPTDAARVLARAADEMDAAEARARARLEELQGDPVGMVTIAAFPSAVRGLIGRTVSSLAEQCPRVSLVVHEAYPEEGVQEALDGSADLAVVHEWENIAITVPATLHTSVLGGDRVELIVPADHPAADRTSVSVAELPGERWITDTTGIYAAWLQQSLEAARVPYEMAGLVDEHESQISLTAHGLGLSLVPRLGRGPLPPGAVALPLDDHAPQRRLLLVERRDTVDRPALRAVRRALHWTAAQVLAHGLSAQAREAGAPQPVAAGRAGRGVCDGGNQP